MFAFRVKNSERCGNLLQKLENFGAGEVDLFMLPRKALRPWLLWLRLGKAHVQQPQGVTDVASMTM